MASLQELDLSLCKSLDYFPSIIGKMEELIAVSVAMTGIKELPPSIINLSDLYHLDLSYCKSLSELPNCLLTLPNLGDLQLAEIHPLGRESFKKVMLKSQPVISFEDIETLNLDNFGLLDEDLHLILRCFQNVQDLSLSRNDFVSLPECIKECANLKVLELNKCKRLRDVPELPSTLENIAARNGTLLTTVSSSRLWSQVKDGFGMRIVMPVTEFAEWVDYCCKGGKLSFRVRGNFPRVLVAYEMGKLNTRVFCLVEVFMSINGRNKMPWIQSDREAKKKGRVLSSQGYQDHVCCYDLLRDFSEEELERLNKFLGSDWNDVDIKLTCQPTDMSIVKCGIYFDKQQISMENIQLMSSDLLSMNASRTSRKRRVLAPHPNESPKKLLRRFKEKINCTKRTRKTKPHQISHSVQYKRKMFLPVSKHLWIALYS